MNSLPPSACSEAGSEPPSPATCPICRSTRSRFFALGQDRLFGLAEGSYPLFRCLECRCIYQHPSPDGADAPGFYPHDYWWSEDGRETGGLARLTARLERSYRDFVTADHLRILSRTRSPDREAAGEWSLLDIGCGNGGFLNLARRRRFRPHGLDVSSRAVEIACSQYGLDVRQGGIGSSAWDGYRFDVVTMFHVLEHLPEPGPALGYAYQLLRPGGRLLVQVPNVESLQARIFGRRWYGLDVPRHIVNFTPKALFLSIESAGFRIAHVSHFSLRDNPAAIASSLAPGLDPIGRRVRSGPHRGFLRLLGELSYAALLLVSLPLALLESLSRRGGTIFVLAVKPTGVHRSSNGKKETGR